jgi:hypothetical protein
LWLVACDLTGGFKGFFDGVPVQLACVGEGELLGIESLLIVDSHPGGLAAAELVVWKGEAFTPRGALGQVAPAVGGLNWNQPKRSTFEPKL